MSVKLPFARRTSDGCIVDVLSVPTGAQCGCVCPACDGEVVAKNNGRIKAPHFAHATECAAAYETAIHEAAKQIIRELGFVWLPASMLGPKRKFVFQGHTLERKFDRVVPDVTVWRDPQRKLAVEIFVTHEVDAEKLAHLRRQKLACVEFDLSDLPRGVTYDALRGMIESDALPSKWIFNEKIEAERRRRLAEERKSEESRLQRWNALFESSRRAARFVGCSATKNRQGYTIYHVPGCPLMCDAEASTFLRMWN